MRILEKKSSFEESPKQKEKEKRSQGRKGNARKILKKPQEGAKTDANEVDLHAGTEYLIKMEQQMEDRRQKQEQIQKYQRKAHSVISLIIDGVEKDIDTERKELKKMIFKKRGGSNAKYIDEDEKTYVPFINNYPELCRSSHLLQIKK